MTTAPGPAPVLDPSGGNSEAEDLRRLKRKAIRNAAILLGVLLALLAVTSLPPVRSLVSGNAARLESFIEGCGIWAPATFVLIVALLVGAGIPRLAFCFLGGALFGFWGGFLSSYAGTMIGYAAVFFAVRRLGIGDMILRRHPAWSKLSGMLKRNSVPAVILFRQIPLPGIAINTVLGLSPIRRREFFLGTTVGIIPEGVPMTLIGAGMSKERMEAAMLYLVAAVVLLAAVWIAWGVWTRRLAAREGAIR